MGQRRIEISFKFLEELLRLNPRDDRLFRGVTSNCPKDVRIVRAVEADITWPSPGVGLICESADWEDGPDGALIPPFTVLLTTHYEGDG